MDHKSNVYNLYDEDYQQTIDKLSNKRIDFTTITLTKDGFSKVKRKSKTYDKQIAQAIKKIPKPKRVSPGYKKKHQAKVQQAIKKVKKGRYRDAHLRKSRQSKGE